MRRVLLVPDRVIVGELGESYFDRSSLSVRAAHDAVEGLRMAAGFRPDLVVLRSDLPGTNPRTFCESLRNLLPKVRLVLVTEVVGDLDAYEGLCDAHLIQPVGAEQLLGTIAHVLQIRTRRAPRVALDALVHIEGFGVSTPDGTCVANAIDVSENGILIEASEQLVLGEPGTLLFFLPDDPERVSATGTACVAMDEVRLHYAIEFRELPESSRGLIARYVAAQQNT